jgi:tetratricopeptide (TPR) repeat protein
MNIIGSELDSNWVDADSGIERGPFQVVISSHNVTEGNFEFRSSIFGKPGTRIYLNSPNHDYYESGIPGLANNFDELISAIEARSGGREIIVIGADTGGHAAIRIGARLGAKTIVAFSPIITLDAPLTPAKDIPAGLSSNVRDLSDIIRQSTSTRFVLLAAEWDIFHMHQFKELGDYANIIKFGLTSIDTGVPPSFRENGELDRLYDAVIKGDEIDYMPLNAGDLLSQPQTVDALYRGKLAAVQNDWDAAVPLYREAVALDPDCEAAIEQLAAYDLTIGDREAAAEKYERCIHLNSERKFYKSRLEALRPTLIETEDGPQLSERDLRDLGDSMMASKDYAKAADAFEKAFRANSSAIGTGLGWAKATFLNGDTSRALRILKDMHKGDPENETIAHNYGAFSLKAGKTRQALKFLGMAHDKDPQNPGFAHQYAIALMRSRKSKDALKPARLAAQERPDNAGFHVTVAEIADAIGDKAAANAAIEEALKLDAEHAPYHALAARILEKSPETLDQAVKHMRNALTLQYGNEVYKNELVRLVEKQRGRG